MVQPTSAFSGDVKRVALRQWLALTITLLLFTATLGYQNGLVQLDLPLYDQFMRINTRPARDDIIIVAIDDYSISQLGRWPWQRALHAQVLNTIMQAKPKAIGLDVIMTEPELSITSTIQGPSGRNNDAALSKALQASNKVVLPMVTAMMGSSITSLLPIPDFLKTARSIGHINLELDKDGVARSVFLKEGQSGSWWPHFALALANIGEQHVTNSRRRLPGGHDSAERRDSHSISGIDDNSGEDTSASENPGKAVPQGEWQRDDQMHIPYAGGTGLFRSIPYISVLRGEVPKDFFHNKYVLIGATAIGMADAFPTPDSGTSGVMPGIEINANILASLLDHRSIRIAPMLQTTLFSIVPVLTVLFSYLLLTPRFSLMLTVLLMLITGAVSYVTFTHGLWIAPSAALIGMGLAYPLWSWCRLEAAISYLGQEFILLDQEPHLLPETKPSGNPLYQGEDLLEQRINAMRNAARRVRDLRQFISDNLDSLPHATLITTIDGGIVVVNRVAQDYFASLGIPNIYGANLPPLFAHVASPPAFETVPLHPFNWPDLLSMTYRQALADGISVQDRKERDLLIKSAPCYSSSQNLSGWIVSIVDISSIRAAERSRDETLRFLSHDMRAPQASILALLELQSDPSSGLPQQEFFARIERASRKTLGLADNFVQLARAESESYRLEEVDFHDVVLDASDEMWTLAHNKKIALVTDIGDGEFVTSIERSLMARALCNLISNAINYSPAATTIRCSLRHGFNIEGAPSHVICDIRDQGYGIAAEDQAKLFQRFQRVSIAGQPKTDGLGLGLVFVKTVIERHSGSLSLISIVGEGTTFTVKIPLMSA